MAASVSERTNLPLAGARSHAFKVILALGVLLAWANSFSGPFVFDDRPAILANPTLASFSSALSPPRDGGTVAGRPLVNLSLALNRAISGTDVWSYHALNLAIHLGAALALFGLVRRTWERGRPARNEGQAGEPPALPGTPLAFTAALLWALHPLQTAAVTYTVQRAESLMALCLLLTLYTFARGASSGPAGRGWLILSVAACAAGMACKEVMAVAPLVVLLYDRTFVAGTFAAAWRRRRAYYVALAATWLPLMVLVSANAGRSGTAGFGGTIAPLDYALTQSGAIVHYLRLAGWPCGLVFDYGTPVVTGLAAVWLPMAVLVVLLAGTLVALRRAPALGFLGAVFFLLLTPSSSVVPIATQTIAEHRVYLPLATLSVVAAVALHAGLLARGRFVVIGLALPLAVLVHVRNRDYRSALALWSDTVARRPENPRARVHLGNALAQAGRPADAIAQFESALRLDPDDAAAHTNLGNALAALDRAAEALPHLETSVRLAPQNVAAQLNLANALLRSGRATDASAHYAAAGRLGPLDASTHYNFGVALTQTREFSAAIEHFRATLAADPSHLGARVNLANALLLSHRAHEAIAEYQFALRLAPNDPQIQRNLALARTQVASP